MGARHLVVRSAKLSSVGVTELEPCHAGATGPLANECHDVAELIIARSDIDRGNVFDGLREFEKCNVIRRGEMNRKQRPIPSYQRAF